MKTIFVKLSPPLNNIYKKDSLTIELSGESTGNELINRIRSEFGSQFPKKERILLLKDKNFIDHDKTLENGDRITIIPQIGCCSN